MVIKSMVLLLFVSCVFGFQIPPEWRDVIQSLCAPIKCANMLWTACSADAGSN